jgi:sporulation protein YlmC with PRC-barrel domain
MDSGGTMRLSDLLNLPVTTESGEHLGRVHDARGELTSRSLRVTGLIVGRLGLLERIGIGAPKSALRLASHDVFEWKDVVRADRRGVIVRDKPQPRV